MGDSIIKSVVLVSGESFTLPPNSTVLTTSGSIDSTCDLPTPETYGCYGVVFKVADGDPAAYGDIWYFKGININGTNYPFSTEFQIDAGNGSAAGMQSHIESNIFLQNVVVWNSAPPGFNSTADGAEYIVLIKSIPSMMDRAYFYYDVRGGGSSIMNLPILSLADLNALTGRTDSCI